MLKKKNYYIDNKKFQEELIKYQSQLKQNIENNLPEPKANDYIGKCILDIAKNYSNKPKFIGYTNLWKEEMMADAIISCIKYGIKKYNTEKYNNPLAYFTEIVHWCFVRRIGIEKFEQYKKLKSQMDNDLILKLSINSYKNDKNEFADDIIKTFEDKIKNKVKKTPKKGIEVFIDSE